MRDGEEQEDWEGEDGENEEDVKDRKKGMEKMGRMERWKDGQECNDYKIKGILKIWVIIFSIIVNILN